MGAETKTILVHRHTPQILNDKKSLTETDLSNNNNKVQTEFPTDYNKPGQEIRNGTAKPIEDDEEDEISSQNSSKSILAKIGTDHTFKRQIVWFNAIGFLFLHLFGLIGIALILFGYTRWQTIPYTLVLLFWSGMGITAGAHRLFSHRAYKASTPLRVFLLLLHTMAGQNCLYVWVRDHRQHHKYSDTDADPHNATRGFFFSHIGWLMSKKHPKVFEYGKKIDMSDLDADPWVMFQKKYYKTLYFIFVLVIPTAIPVLGWNENIIIALLTQYLARTILQLNFTWSVNSVAHIWGNKPYDKNMLPVETKLVAFVAGGEGWHNYHHTFPWDYRAAELGMPLNITTRLIDWFAKHGHAYDRKTVTDSMLRSRVQRTGDGTHHQYGTEALKILNSADETVKEDSSSAESLRKYIVDKNEINKIHAVNGTSKINKIDDLNNNNNNNKFLDDNKLVRNISLNGKQALNVYN